MAEITRHVGKLANTDQRCVIAYMQLPAPSEDFALIIPTDGLQPRTEQAVMDRLNTPEGQQTENFADVLGRHLMPDTGETILEHLHNKGKLVKVPVHNILMFPRPNQPVKLTYILENWPGGSRLRGASQGLNQHQVDNTWERDRFNPHLNNQRAESAEQAKAIARGLLMEAEDLEQIARGKRQQAYSKDPSLQAATEHNRPLPESRKVSDFFAKTPKVADMAGQDYPFRVKPEKEYAYHDAVEHAPPVSPLYGTDGAKVEDARITKLEESMAAMMGMMSQLVESAETEAPAKAKKNVKEAAPEAETSKNKTD